MLVSSRLARGGLVGAVLLAVGAVSASAEGWRVKVQGRGADLGETPVVAELKVEVPPGDYVLRSDDDNTSLPAQVFLDDGKRYLAVVLDHVTASAPRQYTLRREPKSELTPPGVELRRTGSNVEVVVGGKPLTEYRTDDGPKPYYFPVIGPTGAAVTRAYPMKTVEGEDKDHPHQRSLWFTHGKVNGVDFWSEMKGHGSIKETAKKTVVGGSAVGLIRTTDDWIGPDGRKVCEDERVVRFYDTAKGRVFDFDITLKATDGPVTFGDTKEGMFGVRVASSMDVDKKKGGKITNAEGLTDEKAWGQPSPWVDYTGPVEGETLGVAILNHPESFRHPTTWHVRTYGLFAANPFGWHDFGQKRSGDHTLKPGESIRFRYRLILHTGDTASAHLPQAYQAYTSPPTIEVRAE
jgi:hypothetical protein